MARNQELANLQAVLPTAPSREMADSRIEVALGGQGPDALCPVAYSGPITGLAEQQLPAPDALRSGHQVIRPLAGLPGRIQKAAWPKRSPAERHDSASAGSIG